MTSCLDEIRRFEKRVLRKRIKLFIPGILASVCVIAITAVLILLYPKMEDHEQLLFGITLVWPSGVIIVLVPVWTEFIRGLKDNPGSDLYGLLKADISEAFSDSSVLLSALLDFLNQHYRDLISSEIDTRRKALKDIIEAINNAR